MEDYNTITKGLVQTNVSHEEKKASSDLRRL